MIAALAFLNVNKNIIGAAFLVLLGVMIVSGSYISGQRAELSKQAAATAKLNSAIVEQRGKDEAEISAQAEAAETVDAAVKAKIKQTLTLDRDTAVWLRLVK